MVREGFLEEVTSESQTWDSEGRSILSRGHKGNGLEVRASLMTFKSNQIMSPPAQTTAPGGQGFLLMYSLLSCLFALALVDSPIRGAQNSAWPLQGS